jgi:hypothetical protein
MLFIMLFYVKRGEDKKVTLILKLFTDTYLCSEFPGCRKGKTEPAEIIPVEPEQGNACEGKVIIPLLLSFLFLLLTFKPVT